MRAWVVLVLSCACESRPRAGDRTVLIEVDRPSAVVTTNHHLQAEYCSACANEQRPGETLVSCGFTYTDELREGLGYGPYVHWSVLMCSFEAP